MNAASLHLFLLEDTMLYRRNPILHWQPFVCREYVRLRPVDGATGDKVPPSFEFRTFWWRGECVGVGSYWAGFSSYKWTRAEEQEAMRLAGQVAGRIGAPFLVVDVAQTVEGKWIAIECNDGQESGYAGVPPIALWNNLIAVERRQFARSARGIYETTSYVEASHRQGDRQDDWRYDSKRDR